MTFSLPRIPPPSRTLFYLVFAISGFSGLIYESIWSHYLKLYLGHAAYAQTLVLIIFMGGMAIGAWLCSRLSGNWRNVLLGYAIVEGIIGILAIGFHGFFVAFLELVFDSIIPALDSPFQITGFKWLSAALLILPQSILLGMTFPLMVSGVLRRHGDESGRCVATLYFSNSIGAVFGVLTSSFVLIREFGLPGTIMIAGSINVMLALFVAVLATLPRETPDHFPAASEPAQEGGTDWLRILPLIAFVTGAASFIYEIVWIRMLSLVLSSSTHSFELMLSAFILGLAGGGFWIRKRIDKLADPIRTLAIVQIVMGLLALATLPVYGQTFEWMQAVLAMLTKTEASYNLSNVVNHLMALAVMLPATFCAGMTLPLVTAILIRRGKGEQSIGTVYATNTVGAIIGVIFAVHIGLPLLGIKNLLATGAALDIVAGMGLLYLLGRASFRYALPVSVSAIVLFFISVSLFSLDSHKMASGVYRHGIILDPASTEVVWHKDGKTASIDFIRSKNGVLTLSTNGKPEASMLPGNEGTTVDEATMVLAAAVPLSVHPEARIVANIGFGSGLTTHTLLAVPWLERVDTVEIEPAIVEAAKGFGDRVSRAYTDPRSVIHYEDAKTYFSAHGTRYDIIISEPSNPWVSGVAGLFSDEFYGLVTRYLQPDGVFVQWFQLYEIDSNLVSTIIKALGRHFDHYEIYSPDNVNILLVARQDSAIPPPSTGVLAQPALANDLAHVGIHSIQDFELRHLAGKRVFDPLMASYGSPFNSDYYPVLDQNASRTRFMGETARELVELGDAPLPLLSMLDGRDPLWIGELLVTENPWVQRSSQALNAGAILRYLGNGQTSGRFRRLLAEYRLSAEYLRNWSSDCTDRTDSGTLIDALVSTASHVAPFVDPAEFVRVWDGLDWDACKHQLSELQQYWIALVRAVGGRDASAMAHYAELLLDNDRHADYERFGYLLVAGMLGNIADDNAVASLRLWEKYGDRIYGKSQLDLVFKVLAAHSVARDQLLSQK